MSIDKKKKNNKRKKKGNERKSETKHSNEKKIKNETRKSDPEYLLASNSRVVLQTFSKKFRAVQDDLVDRCLLRPQCLADGWLSNAGLGGSGGAKVPWF